MKKIVLSFIFSFVIATASYAVPACPESVKVKQPDGTELVIRVHGDEFLNWTTCGNSLVVQSSDGWWRYASYGSDGAVKAVGARVLSTPAGDGSSVTPPAAAVAKALERRKAVGTISDDRSAISTGNKHFLILLIEFSDKSFTMTKSDFEDLLSSDNYTYNGAVGSVKKYYEDVSFGAFNPIFDVYGPIKVSYTSAQCASSDVEAVIEACQKADTLYNIDYTQYCNSVSSRVDNVFFFFPGYNQAEGGGSSTIWPHAVTYSYPFLTLDGVGFCKYGCTSEFKGSGGGIMAGIGTFSHEFGHVIGLPDFYDVDYSDNGQGNGLSKLSLMSSGNYNNNGRTPPYFNYEEKHILGWDNGLTLLSEGSNTLAKTSTNKTYYTPTSNDDEYFIYESRPQEGWDYYTSTYGMAIYHVDKSDYMMPSGFTAAQQWQYGYKINAYSSHQCMDLVESVSPEEDVSYSQQMVFPGMNDVTSFTSQTQPGALAWSGTATGYNLKNISFNTTTGSTTLTMEKERKIVGTVKNVSGTVIPGVAFSVTKVIETPVSAASSNGPALTTISYEKVAGSGQYNGTSDENGKFEVVVPSSGTYMVSAEKEGFVKYSCSVAVDAVTDVQITMTKPADEAAFVLKKYSSLSVYSVGYGAGNDFYGGLKYTAAELTDYVGSDICSISFIASNGGSGTVDKMGVRVYFDNVVQCDCECADPVFNTLCTVDLSSYGLKIPSGKAVNFVYYVLNPSYAYSGRIADYESPVTGGNMISNSGTAWEAYSGGNMAISASIIVGSKVLDLAGFNLISTKNEQYNAGDSFELKLKESTANPPSSVSWAMDGSPVSGSSVTLSAGIHTITAYLTYSSGRTEVLETKISVK